MKPAWRSKTIALLTVLAGLTAVPGVEELIPGVWLARITAVAGILLRLWTSEGVTLKGGTSNGTAE